MTLWKLNNSFSNNDWIKEEITRATRKYSKTNKNENTKSKLTSGAKEEIYKHLH